MQSAERKGGKRKNEQKVVWLTYRGRSILACFLPLQYIQQKGLKAVQFLQLHS